jgi:hypothetical protein
MKKIIKSGSEFTNENKTQLNETSDYVSTKELNTVYIQFDFHHYEHKFQKRIELVVDVNYLQNQIEKATFHDAEATQYRGDKYFYMGKYSNKFYDQVRYYLISPFNDYSKKCSYLSSFVSSFSRVGDYFGNHQEGRFKVYLEMDISDSVYFPVELNFVPFNELNQNDLSKLGILQAENLHIGMSLASKLQFFSDEDIEITKRCLTQLSNGNHIFYDLNGGQENYEKLSVLEKLKSFQLVRNFVPDEKENRILTEFIGTEIFENFNLPTDKITTYNFPEEDPYPF